MGLFAYIKLCSQGKCALLFPSPLLCALALHKSTFAVLCSRLMILGRIKRRKKGGSEQNELHTTQPCEVGFIIKLTGNLYGKFLCFVKPDHRHFSAMRHPLSKPLTRLVYNRKAINFGPRFSTLFVYTEKLSNLKRRKR